jgi:sulfur-oxidizing protein SoxA
LAHFLERALAIGLTLIAMMAPAIAQVDNTEKELEKFRAMLKADPFANPGNLFIDRGEAIWKRKDGPKAASLEQCDLGLGPGKVEGAHAQMPRYFADADRVMDAETRLMWCMEKLQGHDPKEIVKRKFSSFPDRTSDLEALSAFVAAKSQGMKIEAKLAHPREQESYALGEALFNRRQGPWDFACSSCHEDEGKRIRLQGLPVFGKPKQAQEVMTTWPAFRISQNTLRTMQHRLMDCYWQMRIGEIDFGSDVTVALTTYLTKKAEGGVMDAPGLKR